LSRADTWRPFLPANACRPPSHRRGFPESFFRAFRAFRGSLLWPTWA
jgi:hypothetical protein